MIRRSRICLAFSALLSGQLHAAAAQPLVGPADDTLQIELLQSVIHRGDCGIGSFYSWFANTLDRPGERRTAPDVLKALAASFRSQEARGAFRSAVDEIVRLATESAGSVGYPAGAPKRPFCLNSKSGHGVRVEFSRPVRASDLVFVERTEGAFGEGYSVDVLAFKKDASGAWREFDKVLGSISD